MKPYFDHLTFTETTNINGLSTCKNLPLCISLQILIDCMNYAVSLFRIHQSIRVGLGLFQAGQFSKASYSLPRHSLEKKLSQLIQFVLFALYFILFSFFIIIIKCLVPKYPETRIIIFGLFFTSQNKRTKRIAGNRQFFVEKLRVILFFLVGAASCLIRVKQAKIRGSM